MTRPKIYVAGPMTGSGCPYGNIAEAYRFATDLWDKGWCPVVPHGAALWAMQPGAPFTGAGWLEYDFELLAGCAALFRMPGVSPGGDKEVERARELGLDVYLSSGWEQVPWVNEPPADWVVSNEVPF